MRYRDNKQRNIRLFKNFLKNEHIFYRLSLTKKDTFLPLLIKISEQYFNSFMEDFTKRSSASILKRFQLRDKIIDIGLEIANKKLKEDKMNLLKEIINSFLSLHNLGREWEETVISLIVTGFLCPPVYNLFINKEKIEMPSRNKKIVSQYRRYSARTMLILNPSTSIEDIKDSWNEVRKLHNIAWPRFKDFNLTKNSGHDLIQMLDNEIAKKEVPNAKKYKTELTDMEIAWIKTYPYKEALDFINKFRKNERKKILRNIKIKKTMTDKELVEENFAKRGKKVTKDGMKKAINLMRQHRHRSKMTTL